MNKSEKVAYIACALSLMLAPQIAHGRSTPPNNDDIERARQEQQQRQEQDQQKAQQNQQRQQQDQQRRMQEEQQRQQQNQQRQQQDQQGRIQQEQQRQQEEQQRRVQGEQQAEQLRRNQSAEQKIQQDQARRAQEDQMRAQQEQAHSQQERETSALEQSRRNQEQNLRGQEEAAQRAQQGAAKQQQEELGRESAQGHNFVPNSRAFAPKPIPASAIPLKKALSMPVLEGNASAEQKTHAQQVTRNLQNHLYAVPRSSAPTNIFAMRQQSRDRYFGQYQGDWHNHHYWVNRDNTYVNQVQPGNYPYWYQPDPNWIYANGFTFGGDMNCGPDWLQYGWHPYYGPPPDGFVCARDYFPTPWIYLPAYGVWRQPDSMDYSPSGPPYDYTGPISVEVLEPRTISVRDPYTGWMNQQTVNVIYLYDADFYPDVDRWGYTNRQGYFIWLNL